MTVPLCGVDTPHTAWPPGDRTSRRVLCPDWRVRWSLAGLPADDRTDVCPGAGVVDGIHVACDHDCHRLPGRSPGVSITTSSEPVKAQGVSVVRLPPLRSGFGQ